MSRIGNKPIPIPEPVKVVLDGRTVRVEGPKGKLSWTHRPELTVTVAAAARLVTVKRNDDQRQTRALHGTTRMLIQNMIIGCLAGYERKLELFGVGYGVQLQAGKVLLNVGLANPGTFEVPAGVTVTVQTPQARGETEPARFTVAGADKQAVGEFAARLHRLRPPEPYKGKGVRYAGEYVRRKAGKAFAGAGGAT